MEAKIEVIELRKSDKNGNTCNKNVTYRQIQHDTTLFSIVHAKAEKLDF